MYAETRSEPQVGHWLAGLAADPAMSGSVPRSLSPHWYASYSAASQLPPAAPAADSSSWQLSSRSLAVSVITFVYKNILRKVKKFCTYASFTRQFHSSRKRREREETLDLELENAFLLVLFKFMFQQTYMSEWVSISIHTRCVGKQNSLPEFVMVCLCLEKQ